MVTGGAGFIGSHVVEKLVARDYGVRVLDNLSTGKLSNINPELLSKKVEFVKGDIRDAQLVEKCVKDADYVIHLAAQTSVPFSVENPDLNNDINVHGTSNLLQSSADSKVSKFIFISSCAVYGNPIYLPVDEKHSTCPISPYAQSKLASENQCLALNRQRLLRSTVLRLFNVYGPKQGLSEYSGVITKFIDKIKQKSPLTIYGDGSQTRDFVYVEDVANAVLLALENRESDGGVFNIGTGKATTVQALAETMLSLTRENVAITNFPERVGDIKDSYANIHHAVNQLGYQPAFSLRDGLKALLNEHGLIRE